MKTEDRFDLPQGTLDLLIMRVVAFGPIHGYAIAQRIQLEQEGVLQIAAPAVSGTPMCTERMSRSRRVRMEGWTTA